MMKNSMNKKEMKYEQYKIIYIWLKICLETLIAR